MNTINDTNHDNITLKEKFTEPHSPIALGFLLQLIVKIGIVIWCAILIPAGIFWLITSRLEADTYAQILQNISRFQMVLMQVTVLSTAGQIVLAGVLISSIALFASHKIAGPLIRFEHCVRSLGEGNFRQSVNFRRGDQNASLPGAFNNLCERLRKRINTAQEVMDTLQEIRKRIGEKPAADSDREMSAEILIQIGRMSSKLRDAGTFKHQMNNPEG